jgi:hypothetical protein
MMEETELLLKVLRTAVRVLGYTNQEIEDKLGVYHGYLGRLFKGSIQLQFEDIVRITHALDMEPAELFQLVYPQTPNPATEGVKRLRESLQHLQPAAVPVPEAPAVPPAATPPTTGSAASGLTAAIERELDRLVQQKFEQLVAGLLQGAGRE